MLLLTGPLLSDPLTRGDDLCAGTVASLMDSVVPSSPFGSSSLGVRAGLSSWASICYNPAIVLHPATVEAMMQAKQRGYIEFVHPLQGNAR